MKQGDFFRAFGLLSVAGAGAGLAIVAAALTIGLGATTTVEQFVSAAGSTRSTAPRGAGGRLTIEEIYRLDAPGVVEISVTTPGARRGSGKQAAPAANRPLGSGFVIDKAGHILTNSRVLNGSRSVEISFSGNDRMSARVVGVDDATGIAVLQIDARSRALTPLPLGDSDDVQVGDLVVAIGNPLSFTRTATAGIVSAVERTIDPAESSSTVAHAIETDAAINDGNAGGPLINTHGQVIGVNAPVVAGSGAPAGSGGMGFAIPIDNVKAAVAQLIDKGTVVHSFLGVSAVPVTATLARIFNLPSPRGLLVEAVKNGSGASKAGLKAGATAVVVAGESYRIGGDLIVAADGVPIASEAQLRNVIEALAPGDRISLQLWRAGKRKSVLVTLGRLPA